MKLSDIHIRDPFVLLHEDKYYLYGTRGATCWGEADGFDIKGVEWKYDSFAELADGRRLPENMEMTFSKGSITVRMLLNTRNHRLEDGWATRTKVNTANYTRLTSSQIVRLLSLLIGG